MHLDTRLLLRYEMGSFTFRNVRPTAADSELLELATAINSLQDEETNDILKIDRYLLQ